VAARGCTRLIRSLSLELETFEDWQIAVYVVCCLIRVPLEVFQVMSPQTEEEFLKALKGDDPSLAATAEAMLWRTWCRSGNAEADRIFRVGVDAMQEGKLDEAEAEFTRVIDIAPDFAEGWNKRATVRFMRKDFAGSIADCQETLARNPNHFGASSGQGLCHMSLGEYREAAVCFRRALEIHPHLDAVRYNLTLAEAEGGGSGYLH
jgi:tetratricopeptide (TPR) repeat protein